MTSVDATYISEFDRHTTVDHFNIYIYIDIQ